MSLHDIGSGSSDGRFVQWDEIEMKSDLSKKGQVSGRFFGVAKLLAAVLFTGYVIFRIYTLALVSDEWGGIVEELIGERDLVDLLVFSHIEAQVHFLQALLSFGFVRLFPEHWVVQAARLPSLLGLGLYLFSCWKLTARLNSKPLDFFGFFALCGNAFVLDYFGLARGYGLALGFVALSLFFLIEAVAGRKEGCDPKIRLAGAVWSASFAVLCNMAFANFYAGLATVCLYESIDFKAIKTDGIIRAVKKLFTANGYLFANALALFVFYLHRVLLLIRFDMLYFGGEEGFVRSTVQSLVRSSCYRRDVADGFVLSVAYALVAASVLMSLLLVFRKKWKGITVLSDGATVSVIITVMALFNISGFYLAGVKFVIERAALMFFPVFIFQVIFFASEFSGVLKKTGYAVLIFCVLLGVHGLNFKRTTDYCAYSQTPELLNELVKFHQKTGGMVVIGVTDSTKYTLGWYAERQAGLFEDPETKQYNSGPFKQFEWLVIYSLDYGLNPGDPLHYFPETTHIALQHHMPASKVPCKLKLLKEYPYARTCLYEVEKQE
ncbi:MAG: hypothetical protein MUC65_02470 [Pontiellaceae bacterium]|nr:hypothetical protein [Pontiellaceae bacterium]